MYCKGSNVLRFSKTRNDSFICLHVSEEVDYVQANKESRKVRAVGYGHGSGARLRRSGVRSKAGINSSQTSKGRDLRSLGEFPVAGSKIATQATHSVIHVPVTGNHWIVRLVLNRKLSRDALANVCESKHWFPVRMIRLWIVCKRRA